MKLDHSLAVIVATAVLHNIARNQNDTVIIDSDPDDSIITESIDQPISSEGNYYRRLLLEQYFRLVIFF